MCFFFVLLCLFLLSTFFSFLCLFWFVVVFLFLFCQLLLVRLIWERRLIGCSRIVTMKVRFVGPDSSNFIKESNTRKSCKLQHGRNLCTTVDGWIFGDLSFTWWFWKNTWKYRKLPTSTGNPRIGQSSTAQDLCVKHFYFCCLPSLPHWNFDLKKKVFCMFLFLLGQWVFLIQTTSWTSEIQQGFFKFNWLFSFQLHRLESSLNNGLLPSRFWSQIQAVVQR